VEEYVATGKVRYEFRHYPILGPESERAAVAAVCAEEQGLFWEYKKKLFVVQAQAGQLSDEELNVGRFSDENLVRYGGEAGLDTAALRDCLSRSEALARAQEDERQALSVGLRGTPSFLIDGQPLRGNPPADMAAWRALLDRALAGR
jgi:protein-disulfide isomerase